MTEQIGSQKKKSRLFLSYASADKKYANRLAVELKKSGASVWFDEWELQVGDSIREKIDNSLAISDYLLVLLSPNSINSQWIQDEWRSALSNELNERAITVIPVLVEDCKIPTHLAGKVYLDLRSDFKAGITKLIEQLALTPQIDFGTINEKSFCNLIEGLLKELGFYNIINHLGPTEKRYDIEAHYRNKDPFEKELEEVWLIEIKLYKSGRADLRSISQMFQAIGTMSRNYKGLIVTNGQVTSAARSWLKSAKNNQSGEIRVIDGTELKRLLLRYPALIRKYFQNGAV